MRQEINMFLCANSAGLNLEITAIADDTLFIYLSIYFFFFFFQRKQVLTFHANQIIKLPSPIFSKKQQNLF